MNDVDVAVRRLVYAHFGRTGRAPSRAALATDLGRSVAWVDEHLASLAAAYAVFLGADGEIAKALPFCAEPTRSVVRAGGTTYYGNCAWDAFALAGLLGASSEIELDCGDCGEPVELDEHTVVHLAVPAAQWWEDITFT